jgi:hypothetical protein
MNNKEYKKIKEHFDNISDEEFRQNIAHCGYYRSNYGKIVNINNSLFKNIIKPIPDILGLEYRNIER